MVFGVTAVPDAREGDRLVVLYTASEDCADQALAAIRKQGLPNLFIPRRDHFVKVETLPMLGTGKLDLRALKKMAAEAMARKAETSVTAEV